MRKGLEGVYDKWNISVVLERSFSVETLTTEQLRVQKFGCIIREKPNNSLQRYVKCYSVMYPLTVILLRINIKI